MEYGSKIMKGEYFDSVTLMNVARMISEMAGIEDAAVVMGTRENMSILSSAGLLLNDFKKTDDTDLLVAVKAHDMDSLGMALKSVPDLLDEVRKKKSTVNEEKYYSLDHSLEENPDSDMVLISLPGKYAAGEARRALKAGLHVMLFSDNVGLDDEVELKKLGRDKGLLVMGPDCGTAIINGIPLAFANVVNRGNIGLVAASGTGLQEVSTLISNMGGGISQAIGTGGRDVKKEVGGLMTIEGIKLLASDPATQVIAIVSKPPHRDVVIKIDDLISKLDKPVVAVYLGETIEDRPKLNYYFSDTLEGAAIKALELSKYGKVSADRYPEGQEKLEIKAKEIAGSSSLGQKYLRGLFSGGTFCHEALITFKGVVSSVFCNISANKEHELSDPWKSMGNTVVDLGEDEFTRGRPHPMIDYTLRNKRILAEAMDPEVAVILLDVVLGYGSNMDPGKELVPVLEEVKEIAGTRNTKISVICSVTGTDMDPQNRSKVARELERAGAVVMNSNYEACRLSALVIYELMEGKLEKGV